MSLRMWQSADVRATDGSGKTYPKGREIEVVSYLFKAVNFTTREGQSKTADLQISLLGDGPEEDEIVLIQHKNKQAPYNIVQNMETMTGATMILLERIKA